MEEKDLKPDAPATSDSAKLMPGGSKTFGHYTLVRMLGKGAQGVVYLAEDQKLRRMVALKMLIGAAAQTEAVRDRFMREAEIASKLDHPGICGVHEVGEVKDVPYIAMQYLRGTTLADLIRHARAQAGEETQTVAIDPTETSTSLTGKEATQDILRLVERTARALHVAHEAGLVHRDIKPGNIMISPDGQPVLLDFGLARDVGDHGHTITETGQVMGTPAYMSPEQLRAQRDQVDRKTDVYALGVTLYECLTLRRPFDAPAFEQLYTLILQGTPANPRKLNPRIPIELRTVIEVAMERDQARRYATALDFAEDLRRVRAFEPIRAKPAGPVLRVRRWARREPAKAVGSLALVIFGLSGTVFLVSQRFSRLSAGADHLKRAERLLGSADFAGALEAVAQARERVPTSTRALEIKARIEAASALAEREERKRSDLAAAAEARAESLEGQRVYAEARVGIMELEEKLQAEHGNVFDSYATSRDRGEFARAEHELQVRRLEAEQLLQEAQESIQRAARRESAWGRSAETEASFAAFYLERWREAVLEHDANRAILFRSLVEQHDARGEHTAELLGRGDLTLAATPAECEVHLFRYEPYPTVRPGGPIPRLVPVPTSGVGRARPDAWTDGFYPGDRCLRIEAVEPGSLADDAGLRPGDLVVR
jgi:serine/threonine protein kinase